MFSRWVHRSVNCVAQRQHERMTRSTITHDMRRTSRMMSLADKYYPLGTVFTCTVEDEKGAKKNENKTTSHHHPLCHSGRWRPASNERRLHSRHNQFHFAGTFPVGASIAYIIELYSSAIYSQRESGGWCGILTPAVRYIVVVLCRAIFDLYPRSCVCHVHAYSYVRGNATRRPPLHVVEQHHKTPAAETEAEYA